MTSSNELDALTRRFYAALDAVDLDQATRLVSADARACMGGQNFDRDSWLATGMAFMTPSPMARTKFRI